MRECDGKIVECTWDAKGNQWKLLRVRTDKSFPNAFTTAQSECLAPPSEAPEAHEDAPVLQFQVYIATLKPRQECSHYTFHSMALWMFFIPHLHTCTPHTHTFLAPSQMFVAPSVILLPWRWCWVFAAKSSSRGPKRVWRWQAHDALPCKTTNWCHHRARKWMLDLTVADSDKAHTYNVFII